MELLVKGKNLEVSETMRAFAERKLEKLERRLHPSTRLELELCTERHNEVAELTVWLKGRTLRVKEATPDMKASIDAVVDKLDRELAELRDKRVAKRRIPVETQQ
jgi:putative sigma-54 modulation protein